MPIDIMTGDRSGNKRPWRGCVTIHHQACARVARARGNGQAAVIVVCRTVVLKHTGRWQFQPSRCPTALPLPRGILISFPRTVYVRALGNTTVDGVRLI